MAGNRIRVLRPVPLLWPVIAIVAAVIAGSAWLVMAAREHADVPLSVAGPRLLDMPATRDPVPVRGPDAPSR